MMRPTYHISNIGPLQPTIFGSEIRNTKVIYGVKNMYFIVLARRQSIPLYFT